MKMRILMYTRASAYIYIYIGGIVRELCSTIAATYIVLFAPLSRSPHSAIREPAHGNVLLLRNWVGLIKMFAHPRRLSL